MGSFIKILLQSGLPFLFKWLEHLLEKDTEKKKKKKEGLNEVKEGIKKKDPSKITSGFDIYNSTK